MKKFQAFTFVLLFSVVGCWNELCAQGDIEGSSTIFIKKKGKQVSPKVKKQGKSVSNPAKSTSNTSGTAAKLDLSSAIGIWNGTTANLDAQLEIYEMTDRNAFTGTLKTSGLEITFNGVMNPKTREIIYNEAKVKSGDPQKWSLGMNRGSFSNDGKTIKGTGMDSKGKSYEWRFTKQ